MESWVGLGGKEGHTIQISAGPDRTGDLAVGKQRSYNSANHAHLQKKRPIKIQKFNKCSKKLFE